MEHLTLETPDITANNIDKLLELFPSVATEIIENGKIKKGIDFEKLKQELAEHIVIKDGERYDFTWVGKREAMHVANQPIHKTLKPDQESSVDWENTKNLYIEGENLDALKLLQNGYSGKIKMIYIDPPYNTGKDFIYCDKFTQAKKSYEVKAGIIDEEGNRFYQNKESDGRFHSSWCSMIYPRLKLARNLLSDDGVIFISIDDNEVSNLRKICDEVFGNSNFYGQLIQLKGNTQNDAKSIQKNHEYILVYCKRNQPLLLTYENDIKHEVFEETYYEAVASGQTGNHNTLMERVKLGYTIYYYEGRDTGSSSGHDTLMERVKLGYKLYPNFKYFYSNGKVIHAIAVADYDISKITDNSTEAEVYKDVKALIDLGYTKIRPPKRKGGKLGRWTWGIETFTDYWNKNSVLIKNNKNVIRKEFVSPEDITEINGKKYYCKTNTLPIQSIVKITNSEGTSILSGNQGLMPGINFNNPKSVELIKFFMQSYKKSDSYIILDFFSGSATTAHACMQLNAEDGGHRNFIMVQLPEKTNKEADKSGYKNICEIGKERIRRAGKKIKEEKPDKDLDIGFRVFKIADSNLEDVSYAPKDYDKALLDRVEHNIKTGSTDEDLLYEVLVNCNIELSLSLPHKVETIDDKEIHIVNENELIACFKDDITDNLVRDIAKRKPAKVVFRDNAFQNDAQKINAKGIFKLISPSTEVMVI